jgi:prepilin-type N-terminal cleavage/methylation domain-containing protein
MNLKLHRDINLIKYLQSEQGFSLVETMIALTTLGVCLAYAMPLFLYAKINNSKSEIRTGALIVSQRVFDNIRSKSFSDPTTLTDGKERDPDPESKTPPENTDWIKKSDSSWKATGNTDGTNPIVQPVNMNTIEPAEKLLTYAMGRQYRTKITYCAGVNTDPKICNDKYRKFKVEVSYNGSKVYDLEGNYTEFK